MKVFVTDLAADIITSKKLEILDELSVKQVETTFNVSEKIGL